MCIDEPKIDRFGNYITPVLILGELKSNPNYLSQENWVRIIGIKESLDKTSDFFALKIHGNSMMEVLWGNDIVAVKKQNFANDNDIVLAIIRKYKTMDNSIMLIPFNKDYDPLFFTQDEIKQNCITIVNIIIQIIERNL